MQAVIVAAGRGERMMPLTANTPKPLLKFKGRPLLESALLNLPDAVDEIVVVIGYLGEQIREFVGHEWRGRPVTYVVQDKLDGTGGALLRCKDLLHEKFLVLYGDDLFKKDVLEELSNDGLAILACKKEVNRRVRTLEVDHEGNLKGIRESRTDETEAIIFTGACVLDARIFEEQFVRLPSNPEEMSLPDTLLEFSQHHAIKIVFTDSWISISEPKDLK